MDHCFVCRGQAVGVSFRRAAAALQAAFVASDCDGIEGWGNGCWQAIWLASVYDVRLLVLHPQGIDRGDPFAAAARRNAFAVVCPVILCSADQLSPLPELPNACVYLQSSNDIDTQHTAGFANEL